MLAEFTDKLEAAEARVASQRAKAEGLEDEVPLPPGTHPDSPCRCTAGWAARQPSAG